MTLKFSISHLLNNSIEYTSFSMILSLDRFGNDFKLIYFMTLKLWGCLNDTLLFSSNQFTFNEGIVG